MSEVLQCSYLNNFITSWNSFTKYFFISSICLPLKIGHYNFVKNIVFKNYT